jgi:Periplasmic component of the Tol biopolymer transport system
VSPTIGTRPAVSTSDAGLVIYRAGSGVRLRQFVWFDRSGAEIAKVGEPIPNGLNPSLSPDGRLVALHAEVDANVDIWLLEADRGLINRFTTDPTVEAFPIWSPDGHLIVFNSIRAGGNDLYQKPVDGSGPETLLLETSEIKQPMDWSPDGRFLLYRSRDQVQARYRSLGVAHAPRGKPFPVVQTKFSETTRSSHQTVNGSRISPMSPAASRFTCSRFPASADASAFRRMAVRRCAGATTAESCSTSRWMDGSWRCRFS